MVNRWSSLCLYHEYRRGHLNDLGPNGLNGVAVQPLVWQTFQSGRHVAPANGRPSGVASGYVQVADNAALRLATTGTLIVFGNFGPQNGSRWLISKADGALWNYIFVVNATQMMLQDNTGGRVLAYVVPQKTKMLACSFLTATPAVFYQNGNRVGVATTPSVIVTGAGPTLQIGNGYGTLYGSDPICTALIFNTQLTDAEISDLYCDWLRSRGSLR